MPFLWKAVVTITLVYYVSAVEGNQGTPPAIDGPSEVVIETGQRFNLTCRGDAETRWRYPDNGTAVFSEQQSPGENTLHAENANFLNTGYYSCEQDDRPPARIYVYISDPDHLLVSDKEMIVLSGEQGQNLTIPCRPSSPDVKVEINNLGDEPFSFDPKEGFLFTNLAVFHSGIFVCIASKDDSDTEDVVSYQIHIHPPIHFLSAPYIPPDSLSAIQVGEDVVMSCEIVIQHGSVFNLFWVLPEHHNLTGRVHESQTTVISGVDGLETNQRQLKIVGVQKEDEGIYQCQVETRKEKKATSHSLRVYLLNETFLNLIVETETISVQDGSFRAQWVGKVSAHPAATLVWANSAGKDLSLASSPGKYSIVHTGIKFILNITNITPDDAGVYTITAISDAHNETRNLRLIVDYDPIAFIDSPELFEANKPVNLSCRVSGYPTPNVVWLFKDCDLLTPDCSQASEKPVSGDLITEFSLDDKVESILSWEMDKPGELICKASNVNDKWAQALTRLKITDVPQGFSIETPEEIVEGDAVTFSCRANSYSYNKLEWLYAANDEEEPKPIVGNNEISLTVSRGVYSIQLALNIRNATKENNGLYVCQGGLSGTISTSETVNITVLNPAEPLIFDTNLNSSVIVVEKLQLVVWYCHVSGVPKPTIEWYHDQKPITLTNASEFILDNFNQSLTLLRLSPEDEGVYACYVANKFGSTSAKVTLQILRKLRFPVPLIGSVIFLAILLLVFIIYLTWRLCREKKRRKELSLVGLLNFREGAVDSINPALTLQEQADLLPYHSKWEFPRNRLQLGKQLGAGAFGVVYKAEAKGITVNESSTTVAVKMVKRHSDPATLRDLASELKIMAHMGRHAHVVNLLGAVTTKLAERELLLIVEYCRFGNVRNYILAHRGRFVDQLNPVTGELDLSRARIIGYERNRFQFANIAFAPSVESEQFSGASHDTESTLVSRSPGYVISGDYQSDDALPFSTYVMIAWSFQIARGMEWLASRKILHGDLAARNILLADGNIVKICDFGLARSIYGSPEYQKTGKSPLPIKWMAIESIRSRLFSTQSDVWSYGVVLWEMFSLARTPYPGVDNLSMMSMLDDGYRMEKPEYAPKKLYDLMLECWNAEPAKRPTFTDFSCKLGVLLEDSEREHYLELEEEYRKKDEAEDHAYLSMVRSPNYDDGRAYVNVPSTPGYVEMDGENLELKPMLSSSSDDYLEPRKAPFTTPAVSNPSYEVTLQKPGEKNYGQVGRVRDNITLFESFRKKDNRH